MRPLRHKPLRLVKKEPMLHTESVPVIAEISIRYYANGKIQIQRPPDEVLFLGLLQKAAHTTLQMALAKQQEAPPEVPILTT